MDLLEPTALAQLALAAIVGFTVYTTFFKPKAGEKERMRAKAAAREIVRQRSERWAA